MDLYDRDNAIRDLAERRANLTRDDVREHLDDHLFGGDWNEHDVDDIFAAVREGDWR